MKYSLLSLFIITISLPVYSSPEGEANYAIASRYFTEVYNQGKIELIDVLFVEDYHHTGGSGSTWSGRERLKQTVSRVSGRPGMNFEILESVANEEKVYLMVKRTYDWPDYVPPQGGKTKTSTIENFIFWLKDGKIIRGRTMPSSGPQLRELTGFEGSKEDLIKTLAAAIKK
jgi:hypothetical protein